MSESFKALYFLSLKMRVETLPDPSVYRTDLLENKSLKSAISSIRFKCSSLDLLQ